MKANKRFILVILGIDWEVKVEFKRINKGGGDEQFRFRLCYNNESTLKRLVHCERNVIMIGLFDEERLRQSLLANFCPAIISLSALLKVRARRLEEGKDEDLGGDDAQKHGQGVDCRVGDGGGIARARCAGICQCRGIGICA